MIYDTLVAIAVAMCAAMVLIITMVILLKNGVLSLQGFTEPAELIQASTGYKAFIQLWVALWVAGFFLWFWKKRRTDYWHAGLAITNLLDYRNTGYMVTAGFALNFFIGWGRDAAGTV